MDEGRVKTYIRGLDGLIEGGLPKSSSVLVTGGPGAGKTTLASQYVYNGALHGERGAIVLVGQGRDKFEKDMLSIGFDFKPLEKKGLVRIFELPVYNKRFDAAFSNLVLELTSFAPRRIAMDSFSIFFSSLETKEKHREMMRTMGYLTKDATLLLTMENHDPDKSYSDELFASDAVIELWMDGSSRSERMMRVHKMRRTGHSIDPISYKIGKGGITVLKKPEMTQPQSVSKERTKTGIEGLDKALSGGFYRGTAILISGNSGTGKTTMGFHFSVQGAMEGEKTLYVSFEESEKELIRNITSLGWEIDGLAKSGKLKVFSVYPENLMPDELLITINDMVERDGYRRVVIDSISRLSRSLSNESYMRFLKQMCAICRTKMTTLMLLGGVGDSNSMDTVSETSLSSLVDGIVLLKHIEFLGEMRRCLMIVKLRGLNHDRNIKEFEISEGGIRLKGNLKDIESLMPAIAQETV